MRRLALLALAGIAAAAPPGPPTVRLLGSLPDTLDLDAFCLEGPWSVEECPRGFDACIENDRVVIRADGGAAIGLIRLSSPRAGSVTIPLEHRPLHEVTFAFAGTSQQPGGVSVAGSFNGWDPSAAPMTRQSDGSFRTTLSLAPGTYHYKFVVDGRWIPDPANPARVDDGLGGYNSLLYLDTGASGCRFLKSGIRGDSLVFSYYPVEAAPPSAVTVLLDGHETPFTFDGSRLLVKVNEGSWLRVLGLDSQGRPLRECWTWLDRGIPRGLPGADRGIFDSFVYSLFPDRFRNGDPSNDAPLCHAALHPMVNYQGGDLAGIRQAMAEGYFDSLGVTTVWIGPLYPGPHRAAISPLEYSDQMRALPVPTLDSLLAAMLDPYFGARPLPIPDDEFPAALMYSGYHGYWPARDRDIEPRFGTVALMRELVAEAHARGLRVMLDLVPHHVHEDHPWVAAHPDWFQPLVLPDGTLNLRHWDAHRLTTWFDPFLPTLDLRSGAPGVDSVVASAAWWRTTFDLDGFRHDATKHIPHEFWRALTAGLRATSPERPLFQLGETFGSRRLVGSYAAPAELDGQFDFNLYYASRPLFCGVRGASFVQVAKELEQSLDEFGALHLMANVTGSHDQVRFVTLAQKDIPPGENERRWGWTHRVGVHDPSAYRRLRLFFLFNIAVPGVPVLYYGDEIGMPGAADPDNRRMMRFDGELTPEELTHRASMRELGRLRRDLAALSFGDCVVVRAEEGAMVLMRTFFDQTVVVAFNLGDIPWSAALESDMPRTRLVRRWGEGSSNQYAGGLRLELPPLSALVLATP